MTGYPIRHPDARRGVQSLYYFEKKLTLTSPGAARVRVLADARYKLWVNGRFVACGPCKGSRDRRFYDELDLTGYFMPGENRIAVTLLSMESSDAMEEGHMSLLAVIRGADAYFYLNGTVTDAGEAKPLVTDHTWRVAREDHDTFTPQFFVGLNEHVTPGFGEVLAWIDAETAPLGVLTEGDDVPFGEILSSYAAPRPIPQMLYVPREFTYHDGYYDAGELTTAYVRLTARGKGTLTVRYGECFVKGDDTHFEKGDRTDTTGHLLGHDDTFEINGTLEFESFWFRTFRYVKVTCEGGAELTGLSFVETGYPLEIGGGYDFGDARHNALWDISLRTLRRCMQETYVDCPYYEQLQYCMDTYAQMQFTYMISPDTRLAKRALRDFGTTWRPGFLTEARAPSSKRQYIPGFSLFYILMLNMYEARTEDDAEVRRYLPVIDGILDYFACHRNEAGLIAASDMWDFVDWADDWRHDEGAPVTKRGEGITVYSLMYAYALRKAARLARVFGRGSVAEEYLLRADEMTECVKNACFNKETGLLFDSEEHRATSQHSQIWAVLTGLFTGDAAKSALEKSCLLSARGGYAYSYLWFRALETAGCYELGRGMMEDYYGLLDKHCSTIPEMPYAYSRSECHAWGAVALYEFTSMILGVKLRDDSPRILHIAPRPDGQTHAAGDVYTKWGCVRVEWKTQDGVFTLRLTVPDTVAPEVTVPAGYSAYRIVLNGKEIPPHHVG